MANEVIQAGNKIEMKPLYRWNSDAELPDKPYISQFVEWVDSNIALIVVPLYQGSLVPLRVDDAYELCFYTKGGLYQCKAVVTKRLKKENNIAMAEVKITSALEKFQRRQFYRMNCIAPLTFAVLSSEQISLYMDFKYCMVKEKKAEIEEKILAEKIEFHKGVVLDISGGGMRFNSEKMNDPDSVLVLMPEMPDDVQQKVSLLFGRVISSNKIPHKEPPMYDNRIEFVKIRPIEQESIITYIFKEERERRKREADFR